MFKGGNWNFPLWQVSLKLDCHWRPDFPGKENARKLQLGLVLMLSASVKWPRGKGRDPGAGGPCQALSRMVELQGQIEREWGFWSWQSHLLSVSTNQNLRITFVILLFFFCNISVLIYLLCWLDIYSKCRAVSEMRKILISSWYLLIPGCLSHIVCLPIDYALN